jgi:hypothetical protein
MTFFSNFFNPRGISVEAFFGVENSKTWESSPEMPQTGSPLATLKGGLEYLYCTVHPVAPRGIKRRDFQKNLECPPCIEI